MNRRSIRRLAAPALALVLAVGLAACGGDSEGPTSATPPPAVGGTYAGSWDLHVLRKSDGFQKQFECYGTITLVQSPAVGSISTLSGFAVVDAGCPPESYDLSGSVSAGGAIEFTTNGPKPPELTCPGAKNVRYTGQVETDDGFASMAARGVTTVTCPQFGEHEFTYLISLTRVN